MEKAGAFVAPAATTDGRTYPALETALFALIAFLPSLAAGYVYDDVLLVRDNRYAHSLAHLGRAFSTYFWQLDERGSGGLLYYRPLVTVSYALNWVISGGKPWFFHFFNVVFHAMTTYLVVLVVRRWTGRDVLAIAVALLFALHPSRTESVIWIAGRTDIMMTFLMLLSLELFHRVDEASGSRKTALAAGSLVSFVFALLCKEAAVMLPLLLIVDAFASSDPAKRRRLLWAAAPHTALAALYTVLRTFAFPVDPIHQTVVTPRYGFMTVFAYAERALFPWPQTFFHRPLTAQGPDFVFPLPLVVGGAVLVVAYAALVLRLLVRDRAAALLLVGAAVAFGPLLNFTYTGIFVTTSDHFLYLPLLLFSAALARSYRDFLVRASRLRWVKVAFGALIVTYAGVSTARTFDYKDQATIFLHELRLNPNNPLVLKSLSETQALDGNTDEAFELLLMAERPEARKYTLLVPEWLDYQNYLRLLSLQAARTADGNVTDLTELYREIDALIRKRPAPWIGHVGQLPIGRRIAKTSQAHATENGGLALLTAEAALIAGRLGDDDRARELLGTLNPERDLDVLPNPQNVALTYARLEDFGAARRWLNRVAERLAYRYPAESLLPVRHRLDRAEALFLHAARLDDTVRRRFRAEADLELGAYLRGLRELRPAFDANPNDPEIGPLYVNLLVAAGLPQEARHAAAHAIGPVEAAAFVDGIQSGLPVHLRKLRKTVEPSEWYAQGGGGAR